MVIKVMYLFLILILMSGCGASNDKKIQQLRQEIQTIKDQKTKENKELQNKIAVLEYNERKKMCSPFYNIYKKCYGIGIMNSSKEQCLRAGIATVEALKTSSLNNYELQKTMATLCMMACKTAGSNEGMLSYNKFDSEICKPK